LNTTETNWPAGLVYRADLLEKAEERELVARLEQVQFSEVHMHGVVARRRVAHFGWLYGYESWRISPGPPIPEFLLPLRAQTAAFARLDPDQFVEVLITEYRPGSAIGWHRDAPAFGPVVAGVSLLGACRLRLRRGKDEQRETFSLELQPRSAYLLTGPARYQWQHSIPAVRALRYSVTFRTLRVSPPK
jgi:alkylated DNA repair protein (DNA oxidative demethylase)